MATSNATTKCHVCREETTTYICTGCSTHFCVDDLMKHREELKSQFHGIADQRNQFTQVLSDQHKSNTNDHPLINKINQWERTAIDKIQQTANEQRQLVQQSIHEHAQIIQTKLSTLTEEMQKIAKKNVFNEVVLYKLRTQLENLQKQLNQQSPIAIEEESSSTYINKLSIIVTSATEDVIIADNVVHHLRFNGIGAGSTIQYFPARTIDILIQGNHVYDIGQHILCDQAAINQPHYATFMWEIYLDEGSSDILVSNNIVYNTGWASIFQHYGANNTIINNVFARASLIPRPQSIDPFPDGDLHILVPENHTSWTFTRNIIDDTFQEANHSAYTSQPNVIASFYENIYSNPYGTPLLFGPNQTSFHQWQQSGQDNGSLTIQQNSPAAKLGFINLTKPFKWTPGSDTSIDNQFYHW